MQYHHDEDSEWHNLSIDDIWTLGKYLACFPENDFQINRAFFKAMSMQDPFWRDLLLGETSGSMGIYDLMHPIEPIEEQKVGSEKITSCKLQK